MSRKQEVEPGLVAATRQRLTNYWAREPHDMPSSSDLAREIEKKTGDKISGQALLKLKKYGMAGEAVVSTLEKFFGERRESWLSLLEPKPQARAERAVERQERYPSVETAFREARMTGLVTEEILDVVRDRIGQHKGDGPTVDEVHAEIRAAMKRRGELEKFYQTDDALERKPTLPKRRT